MGEMLIDGAEGTLRLDGDGRLWLRKHGANDEHEHIYSWDDRVFGGDCVYISCLKYLDSFRSGVPHPTEAAGYLSNMRIVEAVYESAAGGRRISLDGHRNA